MLKIYFGDVHGSHGKIDLNGNHNRSQEMEL